MTDFLYYWWWRARFELYMLVWDILRFFGVKPRD